MATSVNTDEILNELFDEIKKLDDIERKRLLRDIKLKLLDDKKIDSLAKYDRKKIKAPTSKELNQIIHEARNYAK